MADPIWRSHNGLFYTPMKNLTMGVLVSLVLNLLSDFENFENPRWRNQYGGRKAGEIDIEQRLAILMDNLREAIDKLAPQKTVSHRKPTPP